MRPLAVLLLVLAGCDAGEPAADAAAADVPDGARCAALDAREVCEDGACRREPCRGDEVCSESACVPWTEAALWADFALTYAETPRAIAVTVLPGGFPRAHAEAIRFTFGDGISGFGEVLAHRYASEGVYPVELEVRMRDGRVLRASELAVIDPPAGASPLFLTVNEIPAYLNGSVPMTRTGASREDPGDDVLEPFVLELPTHGFTVDVTLLEDPADPIDRETLSLVADVIMGAPAGSELAGRLRFEEGESLGVPRARWRVGPEEAAPEGPLTLMLSARTASGRERSASLTVRTALLTPERDPFDRPVRWLFRDDTDFFEARLDPEGGLAIVEAPNGEPDLIEELARIGAQGDDAALNARYLAWIEEAIRTDVYRYYGIAPDGTPNDGIALTIAWSAEAGAPEPAAFAPDGDFSMMRFGGRFSGGYLGYSAIAPYNEERVDDSTLERGVATATLLSTLLTTPVIREAFDAILPGRGDVLGAHDADAVVLDPSFDPYAAHDEAILARYDTLRRLARYVALAVGSVTAHEMGHAMGLMPNGAPPAGFFGGVLDVSFIDPSHTDPHHADFPGLNLMQSGGGFTEVIDEALATIELPRGATLLELAEILALENRLSPYARAYLQGRLTHAPAAAMPSGLRVGCR
ncbi:MAG: PKD domain-containing protein [Sandaracinaceae bacterium]|nr:PKD domain-containing protein [Sandaracinaceae bacterium]